MNDLSKRIAGLSPEKRALLELHLAKAGKTKTEEKSIRRRPLSSQYPLSFAQQRLWFLQQLEPDAPVYNMSSVFRIQGNLDIKAMQQAADSLIRRHETLRTIVTLADGKPVSTVFKQWVFELPLKDLSVMPEEIRETETRQLIEQEIRRPFDLSSDLMLRGMLIKTGEAEHIWLTVQHHIASDFWSSGIRNRELGFFYDAFSRGLPPELPELPIRYADFAQWQQEWINTPQAEKQLDYWKKQLGGELPVLELPADRPRPAMQTYPGQTESLLLSQNLVADLKNLSRRENSTLFMSLLTAFQILLFRYSGQEDMIVGSPVAGRVRAETEGLIGCFLNTLAFRTDLSGNPTFSEALKRVRQTTLDAYANQDIPFEKLAETLRVPRDPSRSPIFQVLIDYLNVPSAPLKLGDLEVTRLEYHNRTAMFDLTLYIREGSNKSGFLKKSDLFSTGEMLLTAEYNTDLFDSDTISRMLTHFRMLLEGIVANPDQRIGFLPLLTESERRQILTEWNDTRREYPGEKCIHRLFEAQAERTPDAPALICETPQPASGIQQPATSNQHPATSNQHPATSNQHPATSNQHPETSNQHPETSNQHPETSIQKLTYRHLNRQANLIAYHLMKLGAAPGMRIGLCSGRSPETVAGILGILKTGGICVPLDPSYPKERLEFMLSDADIPLLLTAERLSGMLSKPGMRTVYLDTILQEKSDFSKKSDFLTNPMSRITAGNMMYVIGISGNRSQGTGDREHELKNPAASVTGESPAYIIYTSGSSGQPKGVLIPHRLIVNRLNWSWEAFPFEPGEVCCQKTAMNFVDSLWEIFAPLLKGIPATVIPDESAKDMSRFVQMLSDFRVTRILIVPSLLKLILDTCPDLQTRLPFLKLWFSSGEALSKTLLEDFQEKMPHASLYNIYGASEAWDISYYQGVGYKLQVTGYRAQVAGKTESATSNQHPATSIQQPASSNQQPATSNQQQASSNRHPASSIQHRVPVGRPVANMETYILDGNLQPVPVRVPGTLYAGGEGLANGYVSRQELTAEKFIPHPFSKDPDARLYNTGDTARYLPDGNIDYLGRSDDQVKIRGFRIEPGEIETLLLRHPGVKEAAVICREDEKKEKFLTAYIVPAGTPAPETSELRDFLKQKLPDYMIPPVFVALESLPLTPSGKVNRRALPAPDRTAGLKESFVAPRDAAERELTRIWEEILDVRPLGIQNSFFDLGGHSMLAIRMFAEIEKVFGKNIPVAALFQSPTVEGLAKILRGKDRSPQWKYLVPVQKGNTANLPIFYVPPAAMTVLSVAALLKYMGSEYPFYGFQPAGFENDLPPHDRIEEMAADYIREMREVQADGPYFLIGRCVGGLITFEISLQLASQGQRVAFLGILDTLLPPGFHHKVRQRLVREKGIHPSRIDFPRHNRFQERSDFTPEQNRRIRQVEDAHHRARIAYIPGRVYPGKVTFFWSENTPHGIHRPDWEALADEIEFHVVPGDHRSMGDEPHVRVLGAKLKACLERAQADEADRRMKEFSLKSLN